MGIGLTTRIRPLEAADIPAAARLETAHQPRPWTEKTFRDELTADGRIYLAAFEDDLVGFGGVMVLGDEAHLMNLLVAHEVRNRGVARALLAELITSAIEVGARHLTLEVRVRNEAARALYARFGLAPVGVRKDYYGDDDALILWVHDIDTPDYAKQLECLR